MAEADPRYRDGMTKRPSTPSIKITYVNDVGEPQEIGVREIFCRMDGDALVLTQFENADGEKVKFVTRLRGVPTILASPQASDDGLFNGVHTGNSSPIVFS